MIIPIGVIVMLSLNKYLARHNCTLQESWMWNKTMSDQHTSILWAIVYYSNLQIPPGLCMQEKKNDRLYSHNRKIKENRCWKEKPRKRIWRPLITLCYAA